MANPIRIGLLGVGRAGWGMHTKELEGKEALFRYVAACDLIGERRERMAEKYGCKTYESAEELVKDPEVELICVATRSIDHYKHAAMALQAGKHVLAEKPMACEYGQALALKALSGAPGCGRLFVRHNRRFEPNFEYVKEILASGILGKIFEIRLSRNGYDRRNDWQTISDFGGGQCLNWGPHIVDHSLRLLESPLKKLYTHLDQVAAAGDCEDHVKLVLEGENGRIVDMEISGGAALPTPEYLIYGSRGAMSIAQNVAHLRYINPEQRLSPVVANPETPVEQSFGSANTFKSKEAIEWIERDEEIAQHPLDDIWAPLYAAIREDKPFPITLEEAVEVIRVIDEAKRTSRFPV